MSWLLDTNAVIRFLNGRSHALCQRVLATDPHDLVTCSVVKAELRFGAARSRDPAAARLQQDTLLSQMVSLPFDDVAADIYGELRAKLQAAGTPIGPMDYLIASIALARDLVLVTHNTAEFGRVPGLKIEDWEII
jgi:tRNA(fMet)-specific endonuclease VapC